jgi:hypothetical protein
VRAGQEDGGTLDTDDPPAYLALDLWTAIGLDSLDFHPYYKEHGFANTWAALLYVIKRADYTDAPTALLTTRNELV